ncbi:MAG: DEAD/DEAH box helicase [Nanoarchaeota archaeon]|nr:DEAD/DEAH box helicase [Nanoarchaeota archaeon]
MQAFEHLGISPQILKVIEEQRFEMPTEVQEKAIPYALKGIDVIASSATGSGKTLAFGAGIIAKAEQGRGIQALILTPTRELAEQNAMNLKLFSKYKRISIITVYGGVAMGPQFNGLKSASIVVGTPGRILDHIGRNSINLRNVKTLVLDEADRMFDMGFIRDVERIISQCPKERQTMLFSATISPEVVHIAKNYMKNPVRVSVDTYVDPAKLKQVYYPVPDNMKFSLLVHLLKNERSGLAMIFCNTQKTTDFVANNLRKQGLEALAIHGAFTQARRTSTMEKFHLHRFDVLVCTDVASRGLDIKGVTHVYNYDIPKESNQYIHRIGRTARAGKEGKAINLLSERDHDNFSRVLRDNDVKVEKKELPHIERVMIKWREEERGGRFGPRRFGQRSEGSRRFGSGSGQRSGGGYGQRRTSGSGPRHSGSGPRKFGQGKGHSRANPAFEKSQDAYY